MKSLQTSALALLSLTVLSTFSQAGEEIIIIEPISYASKPAEPSPWWMEATGFYGFAQSKLFKASSAAQAGHVDIIGGDLTLGQNIASCGIGGTHAWDIRFGYGYGSNWNSNGYAAIDGELYHEKARVNRFYLMPGYRYSAALGDSWGMFLGVNLGVDNASIKSDMTNGGGDLHAHQSEWGFVYSAEIGLKYQMSKSWYMTLAYEFQGSTASPKLSYEGNEMETRDQYYHTVRLGMGWDF
ncbi:MAG: outer membrane beta-barrel protein [Akkermansia sp.]